MPKKQSHFFHLLTIGYDCSIPQIKDKDIGVDLSQNVDESLFLTLIRLPVAVISKLIYYT